ncbi:hypothetical protein [Haloferula sp.]|uniref:hypothetical protein n=1 Tax=Haloferula sp. TaxID=2497595 RepID=UPI00329B0F31
MNPQAISENEVIDLDASQAQTSASPKTGRWWSFFNRSDRPANSWFGRRPNKRAQFLDEFREEREKLVETIEELTGRIETAESKSERRLSLDPMPVMKGIESISTGQKEVSTALHSLNGLMERAGHTDQQLIAAMSQVDKTLCGVRSTQTETVGALVNVGEKIDHATFRFEDLFDRMSKAEKVMAEDYRKLQHRTLYSIAMIAAAVIVVLCLFMTAPWA